MSAAATAQDWDPGIYHRFRGHRLRPAMDLLRAVGPLPDGGIVDLGCGSGAAGPALARLGRTLTGVDLSPAMLDKARATGAYATLVEADLARWSAPDPVALIFSNAVLHWLPDHAALLPRLAAMLAPGGTLAVQLPHQNNALSHRLWVSLADEMFPGRVDHAQIPGILLPAEYHRILSELGHVSLWETEYYQDLDPATDGHPVRRFTEATFARPILAPLDDSERRALIAAYEAVIGKGYPDGPTGRVLFPFRRLFFTLTT